MEEFGYIPKKAKSVCHEARNGILLCPNHHGGFDKYYFYIKWHSQVTCQPAETMHILTFITFRPMSSLSSTTRKYGNMRRFMELCFISTLIQNGAPSPLPSYGMNTVFVAFIPPRVIALSIPRESEMV
jgi:hypothetical protein